LRTTTKKGDGLRVTVKRPISVEAGASSFEVVVGLLIAVIRTARDYAV
jgi:hypothetical protein